MAVTITLNHQEIARKIGAQLDAQLEGKKCRPFVAPMDVKLPSKRVSRRGDELAFTIAPPDVLIACGEDKVVGAFITGAPDFVVDILSPSAQGNDIRKPSVSPGQTVSRRSTGLRLRNHRARAVSGDIPS